MRPVRASLRSFTNSTRLPKSRFDASRVVPDVARCWTSACLYCSAAVFAVDDRGRQVRDRAIVLARKRSRRASARSFSSRSRRSAPSFGRPKRWLMMCGRSKAGDSQRGLAAGGKLVGTTDGSTGPAPGATAHRGHARVRRAVLAHLRDADRDGLGSNQRLTDDRIARHGLRSDRSADHGITGAWASWARGRTRTRPCCPGKSGNERHCG